MKILVYLGHPAQYHFFKNIVTGLRKKKIDVLYVIRKKDVLENLLESDNESFINILPEGRRSSKVGILLGLFKRDLRLIPIVKQYKPDILIGSDPSISHVGMLFRLPRFTVLEDDYDVIPYLAKLTFPFTSAIIAPQVCDCGKWNYKKISYAGYMKLAYLHPNYFKPTPGDFPDFIIRTSKLDAHHDTGINGLNSQLLWQLIKKLEPHGKVSIISEKPMDEFIKYALSIEPCQMHNYLANSKLLISDSQSMSVEAAILGVPSIRFNDFVGKISVLEELEHKYKLTFGISTKEPHLLMAKVDEMIESNFSAINFNKNKKHMLNDKVDVTEFFVSLLSENVNTRKNK